jgi:hypothetical protein
VATEARMVAQVFFLGWTPGVAQSGETMELLSKHVADEQLTFLDCLPPCFLLAA